MGSVYRGVDLVVCVYGTDGRLCCGGGGMGAAVLRRTVNATTVGSGRERQYGAGCVCVVQPEQPGNVVGAVVDPFGECPRIAPTGLLQNHLLKEVLRT